MTLLWEVTHHDYVDYRAIWFPDNLDMSVGTGARRFGP